VLTLDGRAAWDVQTRFNFQWDPERFTDAAATLTEIRAHHLKVCVWEFPHVSIHDKLFQQLAQRGYPRKTAEGDPYVSVRHVTGNESFGNVLTPLPESGIVDFTNPEAYSWWRDAHRRLFEDGVDVMLCDFGSRFRTTRSRPTAIGAVASQRLPASLPPVRSRRPGNSCRRIPCRWSGAALAGLAASAFPWAGAASRKAIEDSPRRFAADVVGQERQSYYSSDIGGFYGSAQPPQNSTYAGCRRRSSAPICARTAWW
jgi:alpha-D-xyloside xylohydrolase